MFEKVDEGKPETDGTLHFYYSREHRLEHAPQIVRDNYEGKLKPVRGLRVLFSRQNRYILFALVFFVGAAWIYSGFNGLRYSGRLAGISFELQSFSFEEELYTTLKFEDKGRASYDAPVLITAVFVLVDADNQAVNREKLDFMYSGGEQYLRTKNTDYDIIRVDALVSVGGEEKELSAAVKR